VREARHSNYAIIHYPFVLLKVRREAVAAAEAKFQATIAAAKEAAEADAAEAVAAAEASSLDGVMAAEIRRKQAANLGERAQVCYNRS
jgi:hypothetical protein